MNSNNIPKANNQKFLKNMVESASPMQLIVILYDGGIQWLQMAKNEIKKNKEAKIPNWSEFSVFMDKARQILTHLQESLDDKSSKEVSDKLYDLYDFMKHTLTQANVKKNADEIASVIDLLRDLKQSWQEAIKRDSKTAA